MGSDEAIGDGGIRELQVLVTTWVTHWVDLQKETATKGKSQSKSASGRDQLQSFPNLF